MWYVDFNVPQKPFGKNLVLLEVVFSNRFWLIGDSGIRKMKTPAPFYEGHSSLFIIWKHESIYEYKTSFPEPN